MFAKRVQNQSHGIHPLISSSTFSLLLATQLMIDDKIFIKFELISALILCINFNLYFLFSFKYYKRLDTTTKVIILRRFLH